MDRRGFNGLCLNLLAAAALRRLLLAGFAAVGQRPTELGSNLESPLLELARVGEALVHPGLRSWTIWQVAKSFGFKDPSHFSRLFRNRYGMTPRDWCKGGARCLE